MFGSLIDRVDQWQREHRPVAIAYGVVKKFGGDEGSLLVVGLGWYGFMAIYPMLLIVVTVFAFIGVGSLGHSIVHTLQQFPVIGQNFTTGKGGENLDGSVFGLVVGIGGLLYGAQGVTQVAVKALARVWNLPPGEQAGFVPRLGRSLGGLILIGLAFLTNAFVGTVATGIGRGWTVRIGLIVALLIVNVGFYLASFRVMTPGVIRTRDLLPGAAAASVCFTLMITVGTGLVEHQLRGQTSTYGAFASVIGVVAFLFLVAKLTLYSAELNPVLARRLYPRSLRGEPTEADAKALSLRQAEQVPTSEASDEAPSEPATPPRESAPSPSTRS